MRYVKPGVRALGIAESFDADTSTLAGAIVRADRVVDGIGFTNCTVGGVDATESIISLVTQFDRDDLQFLFIGAVAPAWYNILDLTRIHDDTELPVLAVTFEGSTGLEVGIRTEFHDEEQNKRMDRYHDLPSRNSIELNGDTRYLRTVGLDFETATDIVKAFTPEGGRPEPLRIARLAARGANEYFQSYRSAE